MICLIVCVRWSVAILVATTNLGLTYFQAASGDFPHLLIYGPSGAGKKTRITATLRALYGPGVEKIKIDSRVFQTTRSALCK